MRYPRLKEIRRERETVRVFGGYNRNPQIPEGDFYDMKNLSSSSYPMLSTRAPRGTFLIGEGINGIVSADVLCYAQGAELVVGGERIDMGLSDGEKTLVPMGAYLIIMPDKKYINLKNVSDRGDIEARVTAEATVVYCRYNGEPYEISHTGESCDEAEEGALWLDTSGGGAVLKRYSDGAWLEAEPLYERISAEGLGVFSPMEGITVRSGADEYECIIEGAGEGYIVIPAVMPAGSREITVLREMPDLDFITESGNRLWGCRYGEHNGGFVNEIYASALGSFKSWSSFQGTSQDSYRLSLGVSGEFTGACSFADKPTFFKEDCMIRVFGSTPATFRAQVTECRGVQRGSHRSIAVVGDELYYKSRHGVCVYDGSLPRDVSRELGDVRYESAVAGSHGGKYYISMRDGRGAYSLFVYDTVLRLWHREDSTGALGFCEHESELYYIDGEYGQIKTVFGSGDGDDSLIDWMAETGVFGFDSPDKKTVASVSVRLELDVGARAHFFIQYDSSGTWEHVMSVSGGRLRSRSVSLRPRRCDHFRIRAEGKGGMRIYSLSKTLEYGGIE